MIEKLFSHDTRVEYILIYICSEIVVANGRLELANSRILSFKI